jgi:hypothetical protein
MPTKTIILAAALSVLLATLSGGQAFATDQCRDASGKFIKCPPPKAAPPVTKCRDIKTKKFAKCGTPGTEPVPTTK